MNAPHGGWDIHIEPQPGKAGIRFRKAGVLVHCIEVPSSYRTIWTAYDPVEITRKLVH